MPDNGGDGHDVAFVVSRRALKRAGIIGAAVLVLAGVGIGAYFLGRSSTPVDSASRQGSRPAAARSTSTTTTSAAPSTTSVPTTIPPSTSTTAAPSITAFTGDWYEHPTTLTIDSSGNGNVSIPDPAACASRGVLEAPGNVYNFTLTSVQANIAIGTLTSSSGPAPVASTGAPVTATITDASVGQYLILAVSGTTVGQFCNPAATSALECGA